MCELPRQARSLLITSAGAAALLTIPKDGLGAAFGTVGAPVPSDEHCESEKCAPPAMRVSTVTLARTGLCELPGEAQSIFITSAGAEVLLTIHGDGLGAALGRVGAAVP